MRIVIILLLLANLTLYLTRDSTRGGGEAVLLQDQVQPDKIKLLTPQQVAALGPTKVAALADVCVEWGPFADVRSRARADRSRAARARPPAVAKARRVRQRLLGQHGPVRDARRGGKPHRRIAPAGREGACGRRRAARASSRFRSASSARRRRRSRTPKSSRGSASSWRRSSARQQPVSQTLVVVRDPQQPVVARMRELAAAIRGQRSSRSPPASARLDAGTDPASASTRRCRARARAVRGIRGVARGRPVLPGLCRGARNAARRVRASARAAVAGGRRSPVGCIALRPAGDEAGDPARSSASTSGRRRAAPGSGARSSRRCCTMRARSAIASCKLDTLDRMIDALRLYARLGFAVCPPYYHNPMPGVVYMSSTL